MVEEKTIYNLALNERLTIEQGLGDKIEITRVPGGWTYAFDFPGYRLCPVVFVPFNNEFMTMPKKK